MKLLPATPVAESSDPEYLTATDDDLGLTHSLPFEALRDKILEREEGKHDLVVPFSDLSFAALETVEVKGHGLLRMSELAFYQLCMRLKVPPDYMMKCPLELRNANLSYWVEQHEDRKVLLRTRDRENNGTRGVLRAVLPHTYEPIDNLRILEWTAAALKRMNADGPRLSIHFFKIGEESTHIRLLFFKEPFDIYDEPSEYRNEHYFGIHISDSEVGERSFLVDFLDYRSKFDNYAVHLIEQDHLLAQRHIFIDFKFLLNDFLEAVEKVPEGFTAVESVLRTAYRTALGDVQTHIRKFMRHVRQTNDFTESVLAAYGGEAISTRYHVGQAISRAATKLPLDQRLNMEMIAGSYLLEGA